MQFQDYYQTLGVARGASADEIKKAFRKLARKYHPDLSKEPEAEQRMKEINEAYAVLSDPEKRAAYDQLGQGYRSGQEFRPPPDWDMGFEFSGRGFGPFEAGGFSDFFNELFGRMNEQRGGFSGFSGFGSRPEARGEDHHAKIQLDLEDAFHGATRQLSLRVPTTDAYGRAQLNTRTLNVRIPQGVHEGQQIRLAGQGSPGRGGAPAGDLYLEVHFKPHPHLKVDGRDLHLTLPVAPWEAALGAVVPVQLPNGELKVRIPAGVQSGRELRVRGKGIPGHPPGDLLLHIEVVLPAADNDKARQLYQTMARELAFNPRGQAAPPPH
jgi:curved DNA-binding protein